MPITQERTARAHYEAFARTLGLEEPWITYAAELTVALFKENEACGIAFLSQPDWMHQDPVDLVRTMAAQPEYKETLAPLAELFQTCPGRVAHIVWSAQSRVCQPLMEAERTTYIGNQHGRLLCLMGLEFWDPRRQETRMLWNGTENRAMEDPYELDLTTLSLLSDFCRVIPHGFVRSYSFFYVMHPFEKTRLQRLAAMKTRLDLARRLSQEELAELFSGHEEFMAHWAPLDELQFL